MTELSVTALLTAFAAGTISFLSPCVLPIVPGYVSYIAGRTAREAGAAQNGNPALLLAMVFVLGFSTIFVLLGASATLAGQWLLQYKVEATLIGGAFVTLFGAFMTGLLRPAVLERDFRYSSMGSTGGPVQAYLLGLAFGFGWTPCIGPVLGSILMVTTATASPHGIALLATYSAGLGLPFIVAAMFTERFVSYSRRVGRVARVLQLMAGLIMMAIGIAIMTGFLSQAAAWIMETFPGLARIG